ncbi:hypothetical protein EDD37DRAFT_511787 [Exophiala viscosa]|uniref:Zn(2)-C6 fungal-type domain-containing protein n=1 Tax=Exophiala viscosa TaxID=2486360 RepID=A0AAN6IH67_9EURO|nr:hypothetical protein EDD36DRAFT_179016 [Exophiala viscosa]KAI1622240.1 hypothetical protein EDD37DRAFT_511787 [Exophiala viscosa]
MLAITTLSRSSSETDSPRSDTNLRPRRTKHVKSRNGCLTCKIRRVKCDETIPHCRQCTKSGRKCEGPVAPQIRFIHDEPVRKSTSPVSTDISLLVPHHTREERHAFHYFMNRGGSLVAGTVDAEFWETLIVPLSQKYDFVWDTVVSMGALLEHVPYTMLTTTTTKVVNRAHQQALTMYNRAISNVRQLGERGQIDDSVVIMSYVLFACLEFQQRNVKGATDLMKRISKLLANNLTSNTSNQESIFGQAIRDVVTPFVLRKTVLMATLGDNPPFRRVEHESIDDLLSRHPEYSNARVQFYTLVHDAYEIIRLADFAPNFKDENPDNNIVSLQRDLLLDQLIQLKASFIATSSGRTHDPELEWVASYLLMYWAVCYTSLATCESLHQTIFDNYIDHFAEIIEHARTYLLHCGTSTNSRLLSSFDPGVIPPLYFCATRCRDPVLRREALRLMRQAPGQERENLWAYVEPERVAEKIIMVEEGVSDVELQHVGSSLPPEERRFAYLNVVARQGGGRSGKQCQALQMSRFDFASDGSRKLVHEYTWLDDD